MPRAGIRRGRSHELGVLPSVSFQGAGSGSVPEWNFPGSPFRKPIIAIRAPCRIRTSFSMGFSVVRETGKGGRNEISDTRKGRTVDFRNRLRRLSHRRCDGPGEPEGRNRDGSSRDRCRNHSRRHRGRIRGKRGHRRRGAEGRVSGTLFPGDQGHACLYRRRHHGGAGEQPEGTANRRHRPVPDPSLATGIFASRDDGDDGPPASAGKGPVCRRFEFCGGPVGAGDVLCPGSVRSTLLQSVPTSGFRGNRFSVLSGKWCRRAGAQHAGKRASVGKIYGYAPFFRRAPTNDPVSRNSSPIDFRSTSRQRGNFSPWRTPVAFP